jgi:hypothetical protein
MLQRIGLTGLIGGAVMLLNSCAIAPRAMQSPTTAPQPPVAQTIPDPDLTPPPANTTTIQVYFPDPNCAALIPTVAAVPQDQSLDGAIAAVIEKFNTADFAIAGYRVSLNPQTQSAIVDLRLPPDSPRHLSSLSQCESFALFGSLRATLTQNPEWQITTVEFTEQGDAIVL